MRKLLILTMALASAATAKPFAQGPEPELGATVRANVRAQSVNPEPDYTGAPASTSNGRRASDAMIRYETGKLKPLLRTNGKTEVGGQGGAGDTPTLSIPLMSGTPN